MLKLVIKGETYMKKISILGVTGSIGTQTLDVIREEKNDFSLIGISANSNYEKVIDIINEFRPKYVSMGDKKAYEKVREYCKERNFEVEVMEGMDGLCKIATIEDVELVVTSIVGMIGLVPTIKAIEAGKHIALANKETLVVGGEIVTAKAKENKIQILPVDSEHGAVFQCLQGNHKEAVSKVILTASGGPFRGRKIDELKNINVKEALNHPKWNMGKKISIDSATLMNKGLEVIEAHWLFDMEYNNIEVVVHPESIVHSMVEYKDGSVMAQLAKPDMRLPIQYALNFPSRKSSVIPKLNFYEVGKLTFEKPDIETFKPLRLAFEAGNAGKLMPTILNAANEACVDLFLQERIKFLEIGDIIEKCMLKFDYNINLSLDNILEFDGKVKKYVYSNYA